MIKFQFKLLIALFLTVSFHAYAQEQAPANWFNLDLSADKVHGVSTEKAYNELLKNKKPKKTVLVAVIDSGVDPEHEDLKDIMWVNPKEIAGNGKDDDGNGYVDDIHGWNFLGGKDGKNVNYETLELIRIYRELKAKSKLSGSEKKTFEMVKKEYDAKLDEIKGLQARFQPIFDAIATLEKHFGNSTFTLTQVKEIQEGSDDQLKKAKATFSSIAERFGGDAAAAMDYFKGRVGEYVDGQLKYNLNVDFDPRNIIGDDYSNQTQKDYGNSDVYGPNAEHGTHVAGIIGAIRGNGKGMDGVANNVRIMSVRTVPNGDERDKDVANAIRYAVDNGADVVNMSFGKAFSYNKKIVDDAVKYAEQKGVLLVHAAGNDNKNTDVEFNFPTPLYMSGKDQYKRGKKKANNWIEVGALSWMPESDAPAVFSNYGKTTVDLFAPGVDINSTIPEDQYKPNSGTSMAAPVVAGVAALVKSYYPELSAAELKVCLESTVTPISYKVKKPGTEELVDFKDLCIKSGVVNAYNALKKAEEMVKAKK